MSLERLFFVPARATSLLLVLSLLCATVLGGRPEPGFPELTQTPTASRPFPPAQYMPNHDFDTRHIALDLRFDWEREQVIGTETIVLAPLINNLRRVDLDAANMTFRSIKLASGKQLKYESDSIKEKLMISLDKPYQPIDELTIIIEYNTNGPQPRRLGLVGTGIRFIKPSRENPTRPRQIWSQGESEYNHYWFACYDHPNDFFTSELTATVEKPLSVISNGKLLDTKVNKDGTRTFHWKIEQPHASYLSSLIVGEYTPIVSEYEGIPIITNVYPQEVAEGRVTVARLTEMVQFFSEKTGIKYPYAKYAQTTVRDFGGGMENISATTQTDNMIHDARTELDQTSDALQSHELAHQWFGDYLTSRTWADLWLNESFATYFQAMWDEHKLGRDDFLYSDVKANQASYLNTWKQGNRRPIVTRNYANPDAVFDTYAYPRGGAVLHMLRNILGEESWWRAINYYLRKYAHQPVQTEEFRIAIEESTGQAMDWFFDEWLYRMGHPVFRITQAFDPAGKALTLTVEQQQKTDPDSQYPQVALFQTPVDIEIATTSGTRIERVQIEPKREQSFTFAVDSKPLLVNFDYHSTLIKEIEFNKTNEDLIYQLSHDEDVLGRIWAISQLNSRINQEGTAESEKQEIYSALVGFLPRERFWGARYEAVGALAGAKGEMVRNALKAAAKDANARVRARAISSLASSNDPALASFYQQFLNDQSYGVIRAAATALGQTKDRSAFQSLGRLIEVPSWRGTIRVSALEGLAASGDSRALDLGFRFVAVGNDPQVRAAALKILGSLGKNDPRVFPLLSETVRQSFERIDLNMVLAASEALVSLGDPRGLAVFEEISKKVGDIPQIQEMVAQFVDRLKKSQAQAGSPGQKP